MKLLLTTMAVFTFLHNAWALINVIWSVRFIRKGADVSFDQSPSTKFLILLPMYMEASIAGKAIDHFRSLLYPPDLFTVVIVTTANEITTDQKRTTTDCVRQQLGRLTGTGPRTLHIHIQSTTSCKADQLNLALARLREQNDPIFTPETIIGVYDADSRPDTRVLLEVDAESKKNPDIHAFQQPASYFTNFNDLPTGFHGMYLRARPFYNLRFCLYREIPGFARSVKTKNSSAISKLFLGTPNHFLGHGEFIRLKTLRKFGGFPLPSGDTSLGTMLSFAGYGIAPLVTMDQGETPPSWQALFLQGITWYSGCASYWKDLQRILPRGKRPSLMQIIMCLKRWLENMIWCIGPLVLLTTITFVIARHQTTVLLIIIAACVLHACTLLCLICSFESTGNSHVTGIPLSVRNDFHMFVMILATYPLMLLGSCLSPIAYYFLVLRQKLFGRPIIRPKTPRSAKVCTPVSSL